MFLLSACGQYGDLYAPTEDAAQEQTTQQLEEEKVLQQTEEDQAE